MDLNHRPLGYEPNELPGCSTPQIHIISGVEIFKAAAVDHCFGIAEKNSVIAGALAAAPMFPSIPMKFVMVFSRFSC